MRVAAPRLPRRRGCSSSGLICRADDRGDPVIQLSPPLVAGPEEFDEIDRRDVLRTGADRGRGRRCDARRPGRRGSEPLVVGVPTEVKDDERRVALTPDGVRELDAHGVDGARAGGRRRRAPASPTTAYAAAGAEIVADAAEVWARAELVVQGEGAAGRPSSRYLRADLMLFTYLHLAAYPEVAEALLDAGTTGDRLRDRAARRRRAAAARADERGGRAHGGPGRRPLPRAPQRRARRAARRRARACGRPASSCSAPATSAGTRRGSPRAWRPRSTCSTRTSTGCASSTRSTRAASRRWRRTGARSSGRSPRPTS